MEQNAWQQQGPKICMDENVRAVFFFFLSEDTIMWLKMKKKFELR